MGRRIKQREETLRLIYYKRGEYIRKQLKSCLFSSQECLNLAPSRIYIVKIHRHNCRHHKWVTWHSWHAGKTQTKTQVCLANLTSTLCCGQLCLAKFQCDTKIDFVLQTCEKSTFSMSFEEIQSWTLHLHFYPSFTVLFPLNIKTTRKTNSLESFGNIRSYRIVTVPHIFSLHTEVFRESFYQELRRIWKGFFFD